MQRQRVKSEKCQTWTAKFCTNCIVPLEEAIFFFLFCFCGTLWCPDMLSMFSRVWHPNIPEWWPTLRLVQKTGLDARERVNPHDSLQFSHPSKVFNSTHHISNSLWMSKPGISTKRLVQKWNEKKILRDGTWINGICISKVLSVL